MEDFNLVKNYLIDPEILKPESDYFKSIALTGNMLDIVNATEIKLENIFMKASDDYLDLLRYAGVDCEEDAKDKGYCM